MIRRSTCLLCDAELTAFEDGSDRQAHPPSDGCEAKYTDGFGVAIELEPEAPSGVDPEEQTTDDDDLLANLQVFPFVEDVLVEAFNEHGFERLGGASSGRGWTSFSVFQACPYKFKLRYVERAPAVFSVESPSRAIGTLVHAFMALYYTGMMDARYAKLTPRVLYDRLIGHANPKFVGEAWRVFCAYELYFRHEKIIPLAIEHDLRDPRNGESCRFDMVAFVPERIGAMRAGTYIFEHKTVSRFDRAALSWENDGEVIGQVMLWKRLKLDLRFGPLQGVVVNILGKQKVPKFHRAVIAPSSFQIESHKQDLLRWEGLIQLARSTGSWPRARWSCISKYGLCEHYEHCAMADTTQFSEASMLPEGVELDEVSEE